MEARECTVHQRGEKKKTTRRCGAAQRATEGVDVTRIKVATTSEGAAATKSQGQVCQLKCATVWE